MNSLEDKIGEAIDITTRGWRGLPGDIDPSNGLEKNWQEVRPGTYLLSKIENGWIYIRQGSTMLKMEEQDVRTRWKGYP